MLALVAYLAHMNAYSLLAVLGKADCIWCIPNNAAQDGVDLLV
jgi:hypothetical protein